jgi:hypothetical protein
MAPGKSVIAAYETPRRYLRTQITRTTEALASLTLAVPDTGSTP